MEDIKAPQSAMSIRLTPASFPCLPIWDIERSSEPFGHSILLRGDKVERSLNRFGESTFPIHVRTGLHRFPDLYVIKAHDVILTGADNIYFESKPIFFDNIQPEYVRTMFPQEHVPRDLQPSKRVIRPHFPVLSIGHWTGVIYGHFLLEILPKVSHFHALKTIIKDLRIAVSNQIAPHNIAILRQFVPEESILIYDGSSEIIAPPSLYMVSSPLPGSDFALHPQIHTFIGQAKMIAPASKFNAANIYISKAKWRASHKKDYRFFENEEEVRLKLEAIGFHTIYPEEHTWLEQVAIFSQARCIVGEFSSALHNALFSPPGTTIISINYLNYVQDCIASALDQRIAYVSVQPRNTGSSENSFSVEIDAMLPLVDSRTNQ